MNENIKNTLRPIITLAAVAAIISLLVILTYNLTYVDTSGVLTDKQAAAATTIFGGSAEDFEVVPADTWGAKLDAAKTPDFLKITKVIKKNDGALAFEVVVKGYKNGLDVMVGVKDGAVAGVSIVSYGEETPGLGAMNKSEPEFLAALVGKTEAVTVGKGAGDIDAMTSATYSSKGIASAVNIALAAYKESGGAF